MATLIQKLDPWNQLLAVQRVDCACGAPAGQPCELLLKDGQVIHWCHSSRVDRVVQGPKTKLLDATEWMEEMQRIHQRGHPDRTAAVERYLDACGRKKAGER